VWLPYDGFGWRWGINVARCRRETCAIASWASAI